MSEYRDDLPDCMCGHPAIHHDAGTCWTRADGTETWEGDHACDCVWYEADEVAR